MQITVAETVGVEGRGGFYEATGALRDMVPNHVFQLIAMTAMEPPVSFGADDVRSRKVDVFKSMKTVEPHEAVRGQYGAGAVLGKPVKDYRAEPHVDLHSKTENYVALKLEIDNWRWAGVPFYLRTGKYVTTRTSEVAIRFKAAPMAMFEATPTSKVQANWMAVQLQPEEGISLQFEVKQPGPVVDLRSVKTMLRLQGLVQAAAERGLRNLALRRDDGRPDAVPARRPSRGGVARGRRRAQALGRGRARGLPELSGRLGRNPGFGGQSFLPEMLPKVRAIRAMADERGLATRVMLDGGINDRTIRPGVDTALGMPAEAAAAYEAGLKGFYGAQALDPAKPLFDVMLLGLGPDGHTASLIRGQPVLEERGRWVADIAEGRPEARLTLTYPVLGSARAVALLVMGKDKAAMLAHVRSGAEEVPAARLRTAGEVHWFVDRAAAGQG